MINFLHKSGHQRSNLQWHYIKKYLEVLFRKLQFYKNCKIFDCAAKLQLFSVGKSSEMYFQFKFCLELCTTYSILYYFIVWRDSDEKYVSIVT